MKVYKYYLIAILIIIIDQTSKLLVYYNMEMGPIGEIRVMGDWFRLHYLLNPGMAFGLRWDNEYGKLALTFFRLIAMVGIGFYVYHLFKKGAKTGLLISMALILGGAVGNVIDSTFYGVFLNNAPMGSSTPWFHGQVIDMLFFPILDGFFPDWLPFVGGEHYLFFSPVFNIADSSIFIGVVIILLFQKRFFPKKQEYDAPETVNDAAEEESNSKIVD
ncbi:MAG: lipoprotein signal peptidase [Cyclobacteriaceae bacterium]|nr:lipoprotein signal peptidase [Cyclobacteriaceae bacterium]